MIHHGLEWLSGLAQRAAVCACINDNVAGARTPDDTAAILRTLKIGLMDPVGVFMGMTFVTKICAFIALICLVVGVVLAILRKVNAGTRSEALAVFGLIGLAFGVLGAAYGGFNTYLGVQYAHTTRFVIYLPSLIECGLCLLIGVLAWLAARFGNAGARRS